MAKKQTKTTREKSAIKKKRSSLQKEQEKKGGVFLGRPEKFKSPEELRTLFNCYLASCQELVKVPKEIPKETYDRTNIRFGPKTQKISENILVTSFSISEQRKRTKIPTKLGFYLFLGGMSSNTRKSYEIREDFLPTVEAINNFFERILESGGLEGTINPQMVQFVLNTSYGRNPKSLQENMEYSFTGIEIGDVTQEDIKT
ncbi:MAG: hypothetical protein DLD55_00095 [candidate division SR1 bacterium]|nr:MAG: hypothetical protein DLD55_00095 [candidate division SR1 bacterium]